MGCYTATNDHPFDINPNYAFASSGVYIITISGANGSNLKSESLKIIKL